MGHLRSWLGSGLGDGLPIFDRFVNYFSENSATKFYLIFGQSESRANKCWNFVANSGETLAGKTQLKVNKNNNKSKSKQI